MFKLTEEMIDAGAVAVCGMTKEQADHANRMDAYKKATDTARWVWTCMQASAPKDADVLTLRDHFAGQALAAMIAQPDKDGANRGGGGVLNLVAFAYEYADYMLAERAK